MHQFTILTNDNEGKCIKPGTNIWQNPQQKSKLKERSNSEHSQSSASFERMHKMPNLNNECKPGKKKKKEIEGAHNSDNTLLVRSFNKTSYCEIL